MKKKLYKYLVMTFLISWVCWWGVALLVKTTSFKSSDAIPLILFTIGGFGPTIAACFCLEDGFSWRKLGKFLIQYKKNGIWYLLLFALIETIVYVISSQGIFDSFKSIPASIIPFMLLLIFLQVALLGGGNEELGWRGTMQPLLQKMMPNHLATFVVGAVWVCWHIPLWFIEGNVHQGASFVSFAVVGIMLSYWLAAIYHVTGSVICCMILHGLTNTLLSVFVMKINITYWIGLGVLTAVSVIISTVKLKKADHLQASL